MYQRPPPTSSYESQAARWKQGFRGHGAGGAQQQPQSSSTRQSSDLAGALVADLCSSVGSSSFPPRDTMQKFLRQLPTLDPTYVCELLGQKFDDSLWQVQAKALSVMDAILKSACKGKYVDACLDRLPVIEALSHSRKDMLRARAEKVLTTLRALDNGRPPTHADSRVDDPILMETPHPNHAIDAASAGRAPPTVPGGFERVTVPTVSTAPHGAPLPVTASPIAVDGTYATPPAPQPSAFSFLQPSQVTSPIMGPQLVHVEPLHTRTKGATEEMNAQSDGSVEPLTSPPSSAFSFLASSLTPADSTAPSLIPPTVTPPSVVSPVEAPTTEKDELAVDKIHSAFEGLGIDDNDNDPLSAVHLNQSSSASSPTRSIQLSDKDAIQEVLLEMEVPPGPMGLVLDRSIDNMAVIERFIPLPSGERGLLELHPAICPGCALISINSIHVEHKGLDEVGPILASLAANPKVLRFKKFIHNGRTVNPSTLVVPYNPPPQEVPNPEPSLGRQQVEEPEELLRDEPTTICTPSEPPKIASEHMKKLLDYQLRLQEYEQQLEQLIMAHQTGSPPIPDMKNRLAQIHGHVERIQTQGIDAVILGPNPPPDFEEVKQLRSTLVRYAEDLARRIHALANNQGRAVEKLPQESTESDGPPPGEPNGISTAFSFLSAPEPNDSSASIAPAKPTSAFGFLEPSSTAETVRVSSPTAFGFLRPQPSDGASGSPMHLGDDDVPRNVENQSGFAFMSSS